MSSFTKDLEKILEYEFGIKIENAGTKQLHCAIAKAAMKILEPQWKRQAEGKRACYFSAEFLIGRVLHSNMFNLGLLDELNRIFDSNKINPGILEEIEDNALGNGGLGRLAACFLDSSATHDIRLDGYGIRYRYGLFKQYFENSFQKETADNWQKWGDPWSIRREEDAVIIDFEDQKVRAVPYDMPVIGYMSNTINTLRLWQAEAMEEFNFNHFNNQEYELAVAEKNKAEAINAVLYPNDDSIEGKKLRLKQQYFFCSASLKSIIKQYTEKYSDDFSHFSLMFSIQLNDTHPVIAIPELLRLLVSEYYVEISKAFNIVRSTFAYTNHTIMAEALEKWDTKLILSVIPQVYPYIVLINDMLKIELASKGIKGEKQQIYQIIYNGCVQMARLAIFASRSTNGVAQIHTELLKNYVLKEWYCLYPERFSNKTNGITQRRWLALCNKELAAMITDKIGEAWIKDLEKLSELRKYIDSKDLIDEFINIKKQKKQQLCSYIKEKEGIILNPEFVFDIQVKRIHEYKRQLLNAFSILDIFFGLKEGRIKNFCKTAFIFGGKAAPGYRRAKGIIKFINEIAKLINNDTDVCDKMKVIFISNYNVSYAEKLIPAADISEQISTAGTEASGTGNMKFMLNGAVTLGTMDGANIEIVREAGMDNNFIFGGCVEDLKEIEASYSPKTIYNSGIRFKKVLDTLIDGTLDDNKTGLFKELYSSLLEGTDWHRPDVYKLLYDFDSYSETRLKAINSTADKLDFAKKCLMNIASAGRFSSDRTVKEYDRDIWHTIE